MQEHLWHCVRELKSEVDPQQFDIFSHLVFRDAPIDEVWKRLTTFSGTPYEGDPGDPADIGPDQLWLPGFDASATVAPRSTRGDVERKAGHPRGEVGIARPPRRRR